MAWDPVEVFPLSVLESTTLLVAVPVATVEKVVVKQLSVKT